MKYEDLPRDEKTKEIQAEKVEFPVLYPLLTPIDVAGVKTSGIEIREPTVADLKAARTVTDNVERSVRMLCCVSVLAEDDAESLGTRDFNRVSEVLGAFL